MYSNGSHDGGLVEVSSGDWRETEFRRPRFEGLETWGGSKTLVALLGIQHRALHAAWGALTISFTNNPDLPPRHRKVSETR